jgi:hypothetical protein
MSTRNWTLGGFGLAVAALAALSVTACDPYIAENTAQPQVIGVTMVDTNYNETVQFNYTGCTAPYPEPDQAWANSVYPGLCNPDNLDFGIPTVCPVACFPPRMGPAYAPFFLGNTGGSYQTAGGGTYAYALPTAWNLLGAPVSYIDPLEQEFNYGQIRILFNKLMDPKSIQPDPLSCLPTAGATPTLTVTANGTDVTATHAVCYIPNSETEYWGGSIAVTGPDGSLNPNTLYRVQGTVTDQQGNSVNVDVRVTTVPGVDGTAVATPVLRK